MQKSPAFIPHPRLSSRLRIVMLVSALAVTFGSSLLCHAQASSPAPDVLVLSNGDTLHGKLVSELGGKVTFHSDPLGDISLSWDKIKELHSNQKFAVLDKNVKLRGRKTAGNIPI